MNKMQFEYAYNAIATMLSFRGIMENKAGSGDMLWSGHLLRKAMFEESLSGAWCGDEDRQRLMVGYCEHALWALLHLVLEDVFLKPHGVELGVYFPRSEEEGVYPFTKAEMGVVGV